MSDNNKIRDRILIFIEKSGLNKSRFEKETGLSNGYLNNIKGNIGMSKLKDILKTYPELNRDWLLYGEGEMLNSTISDPLPNYELKDLNKKDKNTLIRAISDIAEAERITALTRERNSLNIERILDMLDDLGNEADCITENENPKEIEE